MSEPYLGNIAMYGFNFAIRAWAKCDGQLLPISQNSALFSLLGTFYGGDGRTSFGLPDMRGRVPMHFGTGPGLSSYSIGQKGGVEDVALTIPQLPVHNHGVSAAIKVSSAAGDDPSGTNGYMARGTNIYSKAAGRSGLSDMAADAIDVNESATGGNVAHENRQPYSVINFQIALQGLYPSRN